MPIPRLRAYGGPALFSYGFRPFFLFAALHAGAAVLLWVPVWLGELAPPTAFAPRDWHVHEMLYGYVPAVVTGFLLTAIPNWTGRLPLQGPPLITLFAVWVAGRVAVMVSAIIGWGPAAVIDVAFLALVAAAAAREIVAGRNWRNLKVVAIVSLLAIGNTAFHLEARFFGAADVAIRLGLALVILLITLIGGRIVPSFTRNWLVRENPGRLPASLGRFDAATVAASALALALYVAVPFSPVTGVALLAAAFLQAIRLARWAGDRTRGDPLVFILHVGYAFVAVGFALTAAAAFGLAPPSAGIHAWSAGAVGTMTLAVMTRASLGHTGRELIASPATRTIYLLVVTAAVVRIVAALVPGWSVALVHVAAVAWAGAFLGFAVAYAPVLCGRRLTNATVTP